MVARSGLSGELLKNQLGQLLRVSKRLQIGLKFTVELQSLARLEPGPDDHVSDVDRVGEQRVFLKLLERGAWVVVVHNSIIRPLMNADERRDLKHPRLSAFIRGYFSGPL